MDRDIDRVIELVRRKFPTVKVVQWHKNHPGDDDGLWWFRLPDVENDIQLESSSGTCPVEQAAGAVIDYLRSQLRGSSSA